MRDRVLLRIGEEHPTLPEKLAFAEGRDKCRLQRIVALQRVLANPDAAAKRFARAIERVKAKGDPKPYVGPPKSAFRLSPELGALAVALPGLLNAAMETWESSG